VENREIPIEVEGKEALTAHNQPTSAVTNAMIDSIHSRNWVRLFALLVALAAQDSAKWLFGVLVPEFAPNSYVQ